MKIECNSLSISPIATVALTSAKAAKIAIINHRMIFMLGLVYKISKENPDIFQTVYEQISNSVYKDFLLVPDVEAFIKMYDKYIKLINKYIEESV